MLNIDNEITVYDNVFDFDLSIELISTFKKYKTTHDSQSHGYFSRTKRDLEKLNNPSKLINPIEFAINDFLTKIGDTSKMVEYWYRPAWINVDCHQDVNEYLAKHKQDISNPNNGHIMYLNQATLEGGTVIFNESETCSYVVYPKIGRITRFGGNLFHYVPNPYDRMFGNDQNGIDADSRFVVLFNTWDEYTPGPTEGRIKIANKQRFHLNSFDEWVKLPLFQNIPLSSDVIDFRVHYMGDYVRRVSRNTVEYFICNRRFMTDGFSFQLIRYEIDKDKTKYDSDGKQIISNNSV